MNKSNETELPTRPQSPNSNLASELIISIGTDIVTVLLSAALLVLPIEDGSFWPLAFVAFVPLLLRMWKRSYLSIFFLGFASFYLYLFYTLDWIQVYGLHWRIFLAFMNAVGYGAVFIVYFWLQRKYQLHFYALLLPAILVLFEFHQSIGFLGFPWPLLCHSQVKNLPFVQTASIGGCWLVTFIMLNVNEALAHLSVGHFKGKILRVAVLPLLLIVFSGLWGAISLARTDENNDLLALIVQGSEATNRSWTQEFNRTALDQYRELTLQQIAQQKDIAPTSAPDDQKWLVIWPETAVPDAVEDQRTMVQIIRLASAFDMTFLVGCLTYDPAEGTPLDFQTAWRYREQYNEYNSLVGFFPDRSVVPMYSKIHLVPFGEVIPLKQYVTKMFPAYPWGAQDISPGTGFHVTETPVAKVGAVICYESFFPQPARRMTAEGAQVLVLVSNTSWFQRTRATLQHADFDVLRAVENGIWFCRAATTGVSSVIDPQGHVIAETPMFEPEAVTVPIGLRKGTTMYTRFGDWVPAISGIFVLILLLGAWVVKKEE